MKREALELLSEVVGLAVRHQVWLFLILGGLLQSLARHLWSKWQEKRSLGSEIKAQLWPRTTKRFVVMMNGSASAIFLLIGLQAPLPKTKLLLFPDPVCERGGRQLLVFLHGWRGDARGTWLNFPRLACSDPQVADVTVISIEYPVYLTDRNLPIGELASWINDRLVANGAGRFERIAIIAHSMGGLVARKMVLERRKELRIGLLIEEGTPHMGAADYTALFELMGLSGSNLTKQMLSGSEFLAGLRDDWNQLKEKPISHCYTSNGDEVVAVDSAVFQCAEFHYYPSTGHTDLVKPTSDRDDRYAMPMHQVKQFFQQSP